MRSPITRYQWTLTITVLVVATVANPALCARLTVPADSSQRISVQTAIRAAQSTNDYDRVISHSRTLLEFYPNEPLVRAPIYLAMSAAAEKAGNAALAAEYRGIALAIDPQLLARLGPAKNDAVLGILAMAMQTSAIMQRARLAYRNQHAPENAEPGYSYPTVSVGVAGYQVPAGGYQPPPAYDTSVYQQAEPPPTTPQYQSQFTQLPAAASSPVAVSAAYQSPVQPSSQVQAYQLQNQQPVFAPIIQPAPPTTPSANSNQQTAYQPATQPPSLMYSAPVQPYQAAQSYRSPRIEAQDAAPLRVVYDRSVAGDAAYFEHACGALISAEGGNLAFTRACGEAPYLIPAAEILDISLNLAVGREVGAFHIATRRGLYLQLAIESGSPTESAAVIASLKKRLGLR